MDATPFGAARSSVTGNPVAQPTRHIAIVGNSGAGKTTLSLRLAKRLKAAHICLDDLGFDFELMRDRWPDAREWSELIAIERAKRSEAIVITDGSHVETLVDRLATADAVIFCDLPPWRCIVNTLWRLAKGFWRVDATVYRGLLGNRDQRRKFVRGTLKGRYVGNFGRTGLPITGRLVGIAKSRGVAVIVARSHRDLDRVAATFEPARV